MLAVAASVQASQIPRDSPFRYDEAEFLQLTMNLRGSPVRILVRQASDQLTYLLRDLRSAVMRAGTPAPIETEAHAVPSDDSLGLDDDENLTPARPEAAKRGPEQAINGIQRRPRPFALQHGNLLTEGKDLEAVSLRERKNTRIPASIEKMKSITAPPL
jgi:hypothetical protein